MTILAALLGGIAAAAAVLLLVTGWRKVPVTSTRRHRITPTQMWARYTRRPAGTAGRQRDLRLLAGVVAGTAIFVFTGWLIAIVLVPAVMFLLPILFGQAPRSDIALLEALDRWVRTLATTLPGGRSVTQTLRASRASAPPLLAEEINELVDRLNWGWDPQEALQQFADRLDSPDADAVIASLKLAITHTEGITANLIGVADSLQERLRALRQIENERDRPRQTARIVTVISALMIASTALFGRGYFAPYNSPTGQLVVAGLALAYVGSLILLYRMAMPRRRERILIRTEPARVTVR
jgi:tight adherence protein B